MTGLIARWILRRRVAWLRRKALDLRIESHGFGGDVWGVFAANAYRREARAMDEKADALEATLR